MTPARAIRPSTTTLRASARANEGSGSIPQSPARAILDATTLRETVRAGHSVYAPHTQFARAGQQEPDTHTPCARAGQERFEAHLPYARAGEETR